MFGQTANSSTGAWSRGRLPKALAPSEVYDGHGRAGRRVRDIRRGDTKLRAELRPVNETAHCVERPARPVPRQRRKCATSCRRKLGEQRRNRFGGNVGCLRHPRRAVAVAARVMRIEHRTCVRGDLERLGRPLTPSDCAARSGALRAVPVLLAQCLL